MITGIRIRGFKSLREVELTLGRMNLLVGANASGKSNFLDALRVLQGVGNGFTVSEILDGKPRGATSAAWDGVRGGSAQAGFEGATRADAFTITVNGERPNPLPGVAVIRNGPYMEPWEYSITLAAREGRVRREYLKAGPNEPRLLYDSTKADRGSIDDPVINVRYYRGEVGRQLKMERSRPVLRQFAEATEVEPVLAGAATEIAIQLADIQWVHPEPAVLRGYSQAREVERMGERGENFAALVRTICADPSARAAYLEWLRELRPEEVDDVGTLTGAVGEPLFMLREGGREFPAPVLSDGTLRFAGVAAAFFQPDMPGLLAIEEIENGVHANRARLLVELLRRHAAAGRSQVVATTHSPTVVSWLRPAEHATTFYCRRDPETGEASVTPLSDLPDFDRVAAGRSVGDLLAEGWMEAVG